MIIFTASDSSQGEEKNGDPWERADPFDLPSTLQSPGSGGRPRKMMKVSRVEVSAFLGG